MQVLLDIGNHIEQLLYGIAQGQNDVMFIPKIPWLFDLIFWALYVIIVTKATDFELFMFKLNTAFF